ncbi:MAG: ribonuclease H [Candidatus Lernaella stagnicola]|nr:ribonuclease H [Candidatus Lernaella stagnicola]
MSYSIYTDGSIHENPGKGAWACVIVHDNERQAVVGFAESTTSNRMEILPAIEGLKRTPERAKVKVVSDCKYLVDGFNKWMDKWIARHWLNSGGKPVLNQDLWRELRKLVSTREVEFIWVRGHNGHEMNEEVHRLACEELDRQINE